MNSRIEEFFSIKEIEENQLNLKVLKNLRKADLESSLEQGRELLKIKAFWYKTAKYKYDGTFKQYIKDVSGFEYSWASRLMNGAELADANPEVLLGFKLDHAFLGYSYTIEHWIKFSRGESPVERKPAPTVDENTVYFIRHFSDSYKLKMYTLKDRLEIQIFHPNGIQATAEEAWEYLERRFRKLK
jgi:hypothetical protein